jgi:hypothetical protein
VFDTAKVLKLHRFFTKVLKPAVVAKLHRKSTDRLINRAAEAVSLQH